MAKITSTETVEWPKLGFSIRAGEEKDLPADKDAQKIILSHNAISEVGKAPAPKVESKD